MGSSLYENSRTYLFRPPFTKEKPFAFANGFSFGWGTGRFEARSASAKREAEWGCFVYGSEKALGNTDFYIDIYRTLCYIFINEIQAFIGEKYETKF